MVFRERIENQACSVLGLGGTRNAHNCVIYIDMAKTKLSFDFEK